MPLDPQIQTVLQAVKAAGLPEFWQITPDQAREQYKSRVKRADPVEVPLYRAEDKPIEGPDGGALMLRIYRPRDAAGGELMPVLAWFHGGGFVIGDLDTHDNACRRLAAESDCVVVAVHYRLAPESRFPAAVDDCMAAVRWLATKGHTIGVDPDRIAVGGDSAGGNLATVCALLARTEGYPRIAFQLLIYPCVAPEPETPSHYQFAEGYLLSRNNLTWFYRQYLRNARDTQDFRFGPLEADDFSNLPPALILVAGYDPLRDEGVQYATKLINAGNRVTLVNYEGMVHGFLLMAGVVDAAKRATTECAMALRAALHRR
jgi:acetyl esterase